MQGFGFTTWLRAPSLVTWRRVPRRAGSAAEPVARKNSGGGARESGVCRKVGREFFTDNLLVRVHFIIVMIRWTGLAPWEFEFPFPGSLRLDSM